MDRFPFSGDRDFLSHWHRDHHRAAAAAAATSVRLCQSASDQENADKGYVVPCSSLQHSPFLTCVPLLPDTARQRAHAPHAATDDADPMLPFGVIVVNDNDDDDDDDTTATGSDRILDDELAMIADFLIHFDDDAYYNSRCRGSASGADALLGTQNVVVTWAKEWMTTATTTTTTTTTRTEPAAANIGNSNNDTKRICDPDPSFVVRVFLASSLLRIDLLQQALACIIAERMKEKSPDEIARAFGTSVDCLPHDVVDTLHNDTMWEVSEEDVERLRRWNMNRAFEAWCACAAETER